MAINGARSIDDIHAAVADADITLSAEAPLTLALDRRVDQPRIGRLAATPRSHASGQLVPKDVRPLFHALAADTDHPWKQAARGLELALDCWNRTGDLEAILEYPEFDTPAIRAAVSCLRETPSSYRQLAETTLDAAENIAVVDPASLTPLDRSLLPADEDAYETVSPFVGGEWIPPEFHLYPSATAIVDDLVAAIDAEAAEQVGIVLDQSTIYSPLVEAALDAAEIPYQGGPSFIDDDTVRTFVRLLQTGFSGGGLTVGELRPLLVAAGLDVDRRHDNKRIEHVGASWTDRFEALRTTIRKGTFAEALDVFTEIAASPSGSDLDVLREELETLGLLTSDITADRVDQLTYYLQSFEVPVDTERDGVLLTDAGATAYVDRPVVFYLGLGDGWARTPPEYPWVDSAAFIEQDMRRFELLLQNGQQQYFLVQESMGGDTVTPCVYLQDRLDQSFETFADLPHVEHRTGGATAGDSPFEAADASPDDAIETISQSTLNRLVNCPRDQFFHRLLDGPESLPMARGTVLHEAAELHVNHPDIVGNERERVLDAMCEQVQSYLSETRHAVMRTRLDAGLDVVTRYLDAYPPTDATFDTYGAPKAENDLADRLGLTVDSPLCERWFETPAVGGHGYVDLLNDLETVVDYKTGSKRSAAKVQRQAGLDPVDDTPDFQVLLYLAQHRREYPNERFKFRFVYLLEAVDEWVHGREPPVEDLVTTITYVPQSFSEFVASREVFDRLCETQYQAKVLEQLGYEWYEAFFETHPLPQVEDAPDERDRIKTAFDRQARDEVGDYAYVGKATDGIFSKLETVPDGYYLENDIDAFETFLAARIDELNEYRDSRFPVEFGDNEPNWDRVDYRDLILTDR